MDWTSTKGTRAVGRLRTELRGAFAKHQRDISELQRAVEVNTQDISSLMSMARMLDEKRREHESSIKGIQNLYVTSADGETAVWKGPEGGRKRKRKTKKRKRKRKRRKKRTRHRR
jgi:hypothetical protein